MFGWVGRRAGQAALALAFAIAPLAAQEAPPAAPSSNLAAQLMQEACAHVPPPAHLATGQPTRLSEAQIYRSLQRFIDSRLGQATVDIRSVTGTARWRRPSFEIAIRPDSDPRDIDGNPAREAWENAFFTVFLRPYRPDAARRGDLAADGAIRANTMAPRQIAAGEDAGTLVVPLDFQPRDWSLWRRWEILVLPCLRTSRTDPVSFATGFGREDATLSSPLLGALAGFGGALLSLVVLGFAAASINAHQLLPGANGERAMRRLDPAFICQDAFGYMSLARFQVFLFTLALLGVVGYAFVMTGRIPNLDPTVLVLAGITFGGSTLAAAATKPLVETGSRLWLLGNGLLETPRRRPRWPDLLTGDGEVDITRVQALAFTCFAVASMIVSGSEDLGNFRIPEQLNYLIGLSQTVYVAGKALPADAPRRLNEELRSVRAAERLVLDNPGDAAALAEFRRQAGGIATSLTDVFGDRFLRPALDAYQRRVLAEADAAAAARAALALARAAAAGGASGTIVATATATGG